MDFDPSSGSLLLDEPDCDYSLVLKMTLDTGESSNASDVEVTYDPSLLSVDAVNPGDAYDDYFYTEIDSGIGRILVAAANINIAPVTTGTYTFVTLDVTLLGGNSIDLAITENGGTLDSNIASSTTNNDLLSSTTDASFSVTGSCSITPTPTVTVTAASTTRVIGGGGGGGGGVGTVPPYTPAVSTVIVTTPVPSVSGSVPILTTPVSQTVVPTPGVSTLPSSTFVGPTIPSVSTQGTQPSNTGGPDGSVTNPSAGTVSPTSGQPDPGDVILVEDGEDNKNILIPKESGDIQIVDLDTGDVETIPLSEDVDIDEEDIIFFDQDADEISFVDVKNRDITHIDLDTGEVTKYNGFNDDIKIEDASADFSGLDLGHVIVDPSNGDTILEYVDGRKTHFYPSITHPITLDDPDIGKIVVDPRTFTIFLKEAESGKKSEFNITDSKEISTSVLDISIRDGILRITHVDTGKVFVVDSLKETISLSDSSISNLVLDLKERKLRVLDLVTNKLIIVRFSDTYRAIDSDFDMDPLDEPIVDDNSVDTQEAGIDWMLLGLGLLGLIPLLFFLWFIIALLKKKQIIIEVYDNGDKSPISGVVCELYDLKNEGKKIKSRVKTNSKGVGSFSVSPGDYEVIIHGNGYRMYSDTVVVYEEDELLSVYLDKI